MRRIIVSEFITLDGIMEGPGDVDSFEFAGWTTAYGNEKILKYKYDELVRGGSLLLGKNTYLGFASIWPTVTTAGKFGERMNAIQKLVVSNTLQDARWNNSSIVRGNILEGIKALKEQDGKDILVFGSALLVQALAEHQLIDEYRLLTYPVVLGAGKRLFKEKFGMKLKLIEAKTFDTGVVLLRYIPDIP